MSRHAIAVVSTAAILAGLGGVALGVAIHSAETPQHVVITRTVSPAP